MMTALHTNSDEDSDEVPCKSSDDEGSDGSSPLHVAKKRSIDEAEATVLYFASRILRCTSGASPSPIHPR